MAAGLQLPLIIVGAILAATIRVEEAVLWWLAQAHSHIERTDRQILLHLPLDAEMDKWRHLIENVFCKLEEFKRIVMRACKTDQTVKTMIYIAAAVINSK